MGGRMSGEGRECWWVEMDGRGVGGHSRGLILPMPCCSCAPETDWQISVRRGFLHMSEQWGACQLPVTVFTLYIAVHLKLSLWGAAALSQMFVPQADGSFLVEAFCELFIKIVSGVYSYVFKVKLTMLKYQRIVCQDMWTTACRTQELEWVFPKVLVELQPGALPRRL